MSLALGGLFFVLIQYAAQGGWGIVLRRIGETIFSTIPVMAALFVPVLFGLHDLYEWSHADAAEHDALLALEGALPQRAVLPDPGGAVLRHLVLHRHRLLPRLARLRTRRAIPRCRPACANSPGPRSSSSR